MVKVIPNIIRSNREANSKRDNTESERIKEGIKEKKESIAQHNKEIYGHEDPLQYLYDKHNSNN